MSPQRTVGEIVAFLNSRGLARLGDENSNYRPSEAVVSVSDDTRASHGDLSWVSPKALVDDAGRISRFQGSMLIGPVEVPRDNLSLPYLVRCDRPRLAFAEVVTEFFADQLALTWPMRGESSIASDAKIGARVRLGSGTVIGPAVEIDNDVSVGPNTCLANTTISAGVSIGCNCSIGLAGFGYEKRQDGTFIRFPHLGRVLIESDVEIGSNVCIDRAALGVTYLGRGAKIDNLVHIAHNVRIGQNTLVIANAMIGGSTIIGDDVWIAPSSALMNKIVVGDGAVIGLGAVVTRTVESGTTVVGNPARSLEKKEK